MLPEFTDGTALPAATGLGPRPQRGREPGKVLTDVGGDGPTGAMKVELAGQLVGQEGEVEGLAVWQHPGQERMSGLRPRGLVIPPGSLGSKSGLVLQPWVAQAVELGWAEVRALGGGRRIQLAGVEGGEDFLDVEGRDPMGKLWLFILGPSLTAPDASGQPSRSFSLWNKG